MTAADLSPDDKLLIAVVIGALVLALILIRLIDRQLVASEDAVSDDEADPTTDRHQPTGDT